MELKTLDLASLHFPRVEWKWLRPSVRYPAGADQSPDAFLWAVSVGEQLWAWHPRGTDVAVETTGMARTRALVVKTDGSELEAHGLYLRTSFANARAHDSEWVCALDVLSNRLGFDAAAKGLPPHWREAMESCGLAPHLGALAQRTRYEFLSLRERQFLFDRNWDLAAFELLESMPPEPRADLIEATRRWALSASHAKDAVAHAVMLIRKLGDKAASRLLSAQFSSAEEFRQSLMRMAQPELAQLSQKRIDMLRGLNLPPRTSVFGDPSFEKDTLKLTHTPRTVGDFEVFKDWVALPDVTKKMRELLEIYQ